MAHLTVVKGQNPGQTIPLQKERISLGRNANCDVIFPANDFAVSRDHACILRLGNRYYIEDMGSRNGTYVNDEKIHSRLPLSEGDRIRICDFVYIFHEADPPALAAESAAGPTLDDIPDDFSAYEASISNTSSHLLLESQPAEKLKVLLDITNNLSRALEVDALLPQIVDSLFQLFKQADRGFIILREPREAVGERDAPAERLIPKVIKARRPQDESSASYSRSIVRECLKTAQAFLSDDASQDKRFNLSQSIADFRIRSVMCAPLWSPQDNRAFGVIQLDTQDRSKKFTQDDLAFLMGVANQASFALERAWLHEAALARERLRRDLELAHQVQMSFLPREEPQVPGYEFGRAYEPAQEVGGDYYGFVPLTPRQRLAVLLGDVAGKGVPAALLMAKLSSEARFCLLSQPDLGMAISVLNDQLYENTAQMDRFVTLAAALLDPAAHTVTFVNAGHPAPLIYRRATGKLEEAMPKEFIGLPLGVAKGYPYETHAVALQAGDCVLIFSDGVTEAMDKQNNQIQMKAVHAAVRDGPLPPRELGARIIRLVKQHAAGRSQHDDITLVCFGRAVSGQGLPEKTPAPLPGIS